MENKQVLKSPQTLNIIVVSYLIVPAGGVEGVGATGEKRLVITWHQHFDVVVTFILSGGKQLDVIVPQGAGPCQLLQQVDCVFYWLTHTHTHFSLF